MQRFEGILSFDFLFVFHLLGLAVVCGGGRAGRILPEGECSGSHCYK